MPAATSAAILIKLVAEIVHEFFEGVQFVKELRALDNKS